MKKTFTCDQRMSYSHPPMAIDAVFLHSMWRTGSTYLLSRFSAETRYLSFYEPFNGEISSARKRRMAAEQYQERHKALRHPGSEGGYFSIYDEADPLDGQPLWRHSSPSLCVYDVYNRLSAAGEQLLAACVRLAASRQQTPVFGFCHSGLQIADMHKAFGGVHVYLSRPHRDQFVSYQPEHNDFFVPATVMQLLASAKWFSTALLLVPSLRIWRAAYPASLIRTMPHAATMKLARSIAAGLSLDQKFKLFYLSWLLSHRPAPGVSMETISLPYLQRQPELRQAFESRFGVRLSDLNYPRLDQTLFSQFDVDSAEQAVQRALDSADAQVRVVA
jgi:hypothetical protein